MKSKSAISSLANLLGIEYRGSEISLTGVALSAGEVEAGDLFVAIQGARHHGLDFVTEALSRGAVAVLSDKSVELSVPVLVHPDPKSVIGEVCTIVFGDLNLKLFGVTGTNGKTSVTSYLHKLLTDAGVTTAVSTSVGFETPFASHKTTLTTPELTTLRKHLHNFSEAGGQAAAIEVSAQALTRNRVSGLNFEVVGFTNLSRDHLDDYSDMESYFAAKAVLFSPRYAKQAVIFVGDEYAKRLATQAQVPVTTIGSGGDVEFSYQAGALKLSGAVSVEVDFSAGELMAKNFALALVMLVKAGYPVPNLERATAFQVPGRLELVSDSTPHVYVDYAHTPAGIEAALAEISTRYSGVTLVFGASGNRDAGKRSEMGLAAAKADRVILTDQHPRDEDPALIRRAVASGLNQAGKSFAEIADPHDAIASAIASTPRDQAVLWCGPGHLKYREIAGQKIDFDARKIAKSLVEKC